MADDSTIELNAELKFNPELLGKLIDQEAGIFYSASYKKFIENKREKIIAPRVPKKPTCPYDDPIRKKIFDMVHREKIKQHNQKLKEYEAKLSHQTTLQAYPSTLTGYAQFSTENNPNIAPFLKRRNTIPLSEKSRQYHTYITGSTGSGKSEAIKTFIWHYLTRNKSTGLVLLTPHGEVARQVAKFHLNIDNDRLVYINPAIDGKHYPCINPFDVPNKAHLTDIEAEHYAEGFLQTFEELLKDDFTVHMRTLLQNTLPIIIKLENSNIYDLIDFLEPFDPKEAVSEKIENLIHFAESNFSNQMILKFLNGQFKNDRTFKNTKSSLHTRLRSIFSSTIMQSVLVGKSTVNIENLIDKKKLIIFDFAKGNMPQEWEVLGKFVIISLKVLSLQRDKKDERGEYLTPCHIFIDECQNFITPSLQEVLNESRKFNMFLTLAQQQAGAGMSTELFNSIMGNAGVKLTGRNGDINTLTTMAKSTQTTLDDLQENLGTGRFSLWKKALPDETQKPPVTVTMPTNTLDEKQSMTAEQWEAIKNDQIRRYYRIPRLGEAQTNEKPTESEKKPLNRAYLN